MTLRIESRKFLEKELLFFQENGKVQVSFFYSNFKFVLSRTGSRFFLKKKKENETRSLRSRFLDILIKEDRIAA